jgi:hypothetical protein
MQISYLLTTKQMLNYLTGQGMDGSDSDFVDNAIIYRLSAYNKICGHLGYNIIQTDYIDERYDGNGFDTLFLLNKPVTAVSSVKIDDVDFTDYELIDNYLFDENYWPIGRKNIKVSYTAGYNQSTMPADIRHAALQLISLYAGQLGGAGTTIGKASISDGSGGSESIDTEAESRILNSLNHYKLYVKL